MKHISYNNTSTVTRWLKIEVNCFSQTYFQLWFSNKYQIDHCSLLQFQQKSTLSELHCTNFNLSSESSFNFSVIIIISTNTYTQKESLITSLHKLSHSSRVFIFSIFTVGSMVVSFTLSEVCRSWYHLWNSSGIALVQHNFNRSRFFNVWLVDDCGIVLAKH